MTRVEEQLGARGLREARRLHGVGDVRRYNDRMAAIEFAMEHDDGLGSRGLDRADVVLLAPSRCGKTPTAMYLALDRKSTRLNSSHANISYAVFCLKKKKKINKADDRKIRQKV